MIHDEIECPVYNEAILFYGDCTPKQLFAHLKKEYDIVDAEMSACPSDLGMLHSGDDHYIVWCRELKDVPTLIHELYHLCVKIFDAKGIPLTAENDEAMAYYLSFWVGKILPLIEKCQEAKAKKKAMKTFSKKGAE
jgi:hypothetical protein